MIVITTYFYWALKINGWSDWWKLLNWLIYFIIGRKMVASLRYAFNFSFATYMTKKILLDYPMESFSADCFVKFGKVHYTFWWYISKWKKSNHRGAFRIICLWSALAVYEILTKAYPLPHVILRPQKILCFDLQTVLQRQVWLRQKTFD